MLRRLTCSLLSCCLLAGCSPETPVTEIRAEPASTAQLQFEVSPGTDNWPWWRGPASNGKSPVPPETPLPVEWSKTKNVVWEADVPGRGHSSPAVRDSRIFIATADEQAQVQSLLAYDRETGKSLWQTPIHREGFEHAHETNSQASATPACDGEQVYITFLNKKAIWLSATDLDGHILWQTAAGPFETTHGYAASPALYKSLVIVAGDSTGKSFLAAIDRKTGNIAWRVQRPSEISFSSPVVAHVGGRDQILMMGCDIIAGYDPLTGKMLWSYPGPTETTAGSLTFDDEHVFASGGFPDSKTLCLKGDGQGELSAEYLVWENKERFYVPSPVVDEGYVYAVNGEGIACCFDAATGKLKYKKRLGGGVSASPILAGGHLYLTNQEGKTYVYKTGPKFKLVASNKLADGGYASPAICGGRIYLRTAHHLYCIGQMKKSAR